MFEFSVEGSRAGLTRCAQYNALKHQREAQHHHHHHHGLANSSSSFTAAENMELKF